MAGALTTAGALALVLLLVEAPGPAPASTTAPLPPAATDVDDLTDWARWAGLPGSTRGAALLTTRDVSTTFPADGAWEPAGSADVGGQWVPDWCRDQVLKGELLDQLVEPSDHWVSTWIVPSEDRPVADLRFDAFRWAPGGGAELAAVDAWLQEMTDGAAACDEGEPVETAGVPGQAPVMTVVPARQGSWEVQAATVGGPTALWVRPR